MKFLAKIGTDTLKFVAYRHADGWDIQLAEKSLSVDCCQLSPNSFSLILDGHSYYLVIHENGRHYTVTVNQQTVEIQLQDETSMLLDKFGFSETHAKDLGKIQVPIPGMIASLFVAKGDQVEKGQKLFILEAMKMENELNSPVTGVVKTILVKKGDTVNKGALIMEIVA